MSSYAQHLSGRTTPQTEPLPGRKMVENHAGGYTFEITPEQRLIRFLTTGSEGADVALSLPNYTARGGATYYQSERALTIENAENIQKMVFEDGVGWDLQFTPARTGPPGPRPPRRLRRPWQ